MGSEADSAVVPLEPARLTLALEAARAAVWSLALFHRLSTTLYRDAPGEFSRAS